MIKEQKDDKIAQSLFDTLEENGLVTKDSLRNAIFSILRLEVKGSNKLYKQYETLYFNRITHTTTKNVEQCSHTPQLNPNSVRLAEKSRERRKQIAKETTGDVSDLSLADLLLIAKKTQKEKMEMKRSKKAIEETKECTFNPEISKRRNDPKNKCVALYNKAKNIKKANLETTQEIEYEKPKDELLFAPLLFK